MGIQIHTFLLSCMHCTLSKLTYSVHTYIHTCIYASRLAIAQVQATLYDSTVVVNSYLNAMKLAADVPTVELKGTVYVCMYVCMYVYVYLFICKWCSRLVLNSVCMIYCR